jgi:hypothetical protein
MTIATDLALVVQLATLTEDRSNAEQRALERIAKRVDAEVNKQSSSNPHLPTWSYPLPPCTYSDEHGKDCACRTDRVALEPKAGWSRLAALVEETRA